MTMLPNNLAGRWQTGRGQGTPLIDPVLGGEVARLGAAGADLAEAFSFARERGGSALRSLTYAQRAALLSQIGQLLQANRDAYYEIAIANSGTTRRDSGIDIDGAIFTIGQYAKWGAALGEARALLDGEPARLGKDPAFQARHVLVPARGAALLINAFNFPAWGLWEKAAPALLSGVPVIAKPASVTAWLAQRMVADVIAAGILPDGALSILCGRSEGLLDALEPFDLVSFTGSAETAATIRAHPAVAQRSVRANVEGLLGSIRCPVLAIQGEDDEYGTMAQIDGIAARVPQAELLKLPRCGHAPHRDQPQEVIAAVTRLLHRSRRSPASALRGCPAAKERMGS